MAPWIIDRARAAMSTTERDIARFLSELHERLDKSTALQRELEQRLAQVKARETDLERNFKRRETDMLRKLQDRFDEVVANFEARALDTIQNVKELKEQKKLQEQARLQVARVKREGMEEMQTYVISAAESPAPLSTKPKLEEGARVILKGIRQPARIRRILSDTVIEVDAGFLKMQVSIDDVQEVLPEKDPGGSKLPKNTTFQQAGPKWDRSYQEINVIGKRAEEALEEVDYFLDQAALASVDRVRIVHGHGMGVLKKAVANLLAKSPHVEKFYPATAQEGGAGATIAELKTA
jgi:DNA mismatch repair protein MutS2